MGKLKNYHGLLRKTHSLDKLAEKTGKTPDQLRKTLTTGRMHFATKKKLKEIYKQYIEIIRKPIEESKVSSGGGGKSPHFWNGWRAQLVRIGDVMLLRQVKPKKMPRKDEVEKIRILRNQRKSTRQKIKKLLAQRRRHGLL